MFEYCSMSTNCNIIISKPRCRFTRTFKILASNGYKYIIL